MWGLGTPKKPFLVSGASGCKKPGASTATIQMCGMQFGHNGVWVAPVTKGHMIQQYSEICQHILDGTCTELDLGRLASIKVGYLIVLNGIY